MEVKGEIRDMMRDLSGRYVVSFIVDRPPEKIEGSLDITYKPHKEKRSLNANALLWECIGRIATVLGADKWAVYLQMLKRYGEYTYVCVKPKAVEMLKRQWRECEELGEIDINGQKAMQMLCYYGSSTYNTKQFSRLLDGVISEMREMNIETPGDERIQHSLEQWEKQNGKRNMETANHRS